MGRFKCRRGRLSLLLLPEKWSFTASEERTILTPIHPVIRCREVLASSVAEQPLTARPPETRVIRSTIGRPDRLSVMLIVNDGECD